MELFSQTLSFDFMSKRKAAVIFSLALILLSIGSLVVRGLNFGIDFTGGTVVEVAYPEPVGLGQVRDLLASADYNDAVVQYFGTSKDVLIRLAPQGNQTKEERARLSNRILQTLRQGGDAEMRRVEFVGPQVGKALREDGGLAMIYALVGILIYVALRFEYRFAFGSVIALIHDVIITVGFFSVTQADFDLTVLAAILAVIGYSLNDTIVVFDRIRENFRKMRKAGTLEVINASINQTLSRTLMTSATTLIVVLALFFIGGDVIHSFAEALLVGIGIGTYSSIYVASTALLMLNVSKADLMPAQKEGAEAESRP